MVDNYKNLLFLKKNYFKIKDIYYNKNKKLTNSQKITADAFEYEWTTQRYFFNKLTKASWYKRSIQFWDTNFKNWNRHIFKIIKKNSIILDAGCGAGVNMLPILTNLKNSYYYYGLDVTNSILNAKKTYKKANIPSIFIKSSFQNFFFRKNAFDLIFAIGTLHHADNLIKSTLKLIRPLKKGGYFVFWVYKKQPFIRENVDNLIRSKIVSMSPRLTRRHLIDITAFAKDLYENRSIINIKKGLKILDIKKGSYNFHNFIFKFFFKSVYNKILGFKGSYYENFDWYKPFINNTFNVEEIDNVCKKINVRVINKFISTSGIGIIAQKK